MNDAVDDSDDEVDYTKMDLGNKKVNMEISFYFLVKLCFRSTIKEVNSFESLAVLIFIPNK